MLFADDFKRLGGVCWWRKGGEGVGCCWRGICRVGWCRVGRAVFSATVVVVVAVVVLVLLSSCFHPHVFCRTVHGSIILVVVDD